MKLFIEKAQRKLILLAGALAVLVGAIALTGGATGPAARAERAQQGVAWPQITLRRLAPAFDHPSFVTHAGDGSGRLFVVEQAGRIWILENEQKSDEPFLDISGRVRSYEDPGGGGEEGLLSAAFPPGFADKGYFYVYYTTIESNNVVSRFYLSADPNLADPGSEQQILLIPHPDVNPENVKNHNGGQLAFGPDGHLYLGPGDAQQRVRAQDLGSLLGKVLRIQVEFPSSAIAPAVPSQNAAAQVFLPLVPANPGGPVVEPPTYAIPPDNPFTGTPGARGEIWAIGLRNPWRFSFDSQTGDFYLADVGEREFEEINYRPAGNQGGENYGWPAMEGEECLQGQCSPDQYEYPVHVYSHAAGNCSITGGYVYRGQDYPEMQGIYFFGDYCSGKIWGLQWNNGAVVVEELADTGLRISSFGVDEADELYLIDLQGAVYQVEVAP